MADHPSCPTIILSEWVPFLNKHPDGCAHWCGCECDCEPRPQVVAGPEGLVRGEADS